MNKIRCLLLILCLSSSAYAVEPYTHSGKVFSQTADASQLVIDGQHYVVDNKTLIHGGLARRGELAPLLKIGKKIGFNVVKNSGNLPYISEIWFVE